MNTTLITGASSGIGLELARNAAADGRHLLLSARSESKLEALAQELREKYSVTIHTLAADLSNPTDVDRLIAFANEKGLAIDVLINNAGFGDFGFFHQTGWEKDAQMIDLNIRALTQLTKAFLPGMVQRKSGRVMNVASTASFQPGPFMAVYFATKHYVLAFSEAIANELRGTGVTVTALCPGPTASGFQEAAKMEDSGMIKGKKIPSAAEVAAYGYKSMMRGQTVAVHGIMNRIMAESVRFVPRKWATAIVRKLSVPK